MDEERAFLNAIASDPDDDVARLVFADWLQERGDEDRAEFIRVQCRLAEGASAAAEQELLRRERDLLEAHETQWRRALPPDVSGGWFWGPFERGFVETVFVNDWADFEPAAAAVFAAQPVRRLRVAGLTRESAERFAACPLLRRLTELRLDRHRNGREIAPLLAASPHLTGLRRLDLRANGELMTWAELLAGSEGFPNLRSIRLDVSRLPMAAWDLLRLRFGEGVLGG